MKNTSKPYDALAPIYELWSTGDNAYNSSFRFYVDYLKEIPSPLCELGVGTGRIAFELSSKFGKVIYGIDESEKMLSIVKEKYSTANLNPLLHPRQSDISRFSLPQKVNAVYLPFRTIGHLLTNTSKSCMLQSVYNVLNDDGLFIFDHYMFSKEWAEAHNRKMIQMYKTEELIIEDYYEYDFNNKSIKCKIYMNGVVQSCFDFTYNDPEYFVDLLSNNGFIIDVMYGDFNCSVFNEHSVNQIYVCKKNSNQ